MWPLAPIIVEQRWLATLSFFTSVLRACALWFAVADQDLELGEGGGLIYLPCWLFSFLSFLLFFTQNKGPRAPPLDLPLVCQPFTFNHGHLGLTSHRFHEGINVVDRPHCLSLRPHFSETSRAQSPRGKCISFPRVCVTGTSVEA